MTSGPEQPGAPAARNIVWSDGQVTAAEREALLAQRGCVIWLTGLSGSGKSTVARAAEARLIREGHLAYVLDGDNVRHGLNSDLGFSPGDRAENIRRLGELASLFADAGVITLTAFISPYRADRQAARARAGAGRFVEVHLDVPLDECERRDVKGLYARARAGEIAQFTGIDAPYEAPEAPEVVLKTASETVEQSVDALLTYLTEQGFIIDPSQGT